MTPISRETPDDGRLDGFGIGFRYAEPISDNLSRSETIVETMLSKKGQFRRHKDARSGTNIESGP